MCFLHSGAHAFFWCLLIMTINHIHLSLLTEKSYGNHALRSIQISNIYAIWRPRARGRYIIMPEGSVDIYMYVIYVLKKMEGKIMH